MISKIYDPLGLAAPFLFKGKRILQELCKSNFTWDDAVSDDYIVVWEKWKKELQLLENLKMERFLNYHPTVRSMYIVEDK